MDNNFYFINYKVTNDIKRQDQEKKHFVFLTRNKQIILIALIINSDCPSQFNQINIENLRKNISQHDLDNHC